MKRLIWLWALVLGIAGCAGDSEGGAENTEANSEGLASEVSIYTDALASGWNDWSWASRNLRNASPAQGSRSIAVTYGPWQGLYFNHAPFSAEGLTHLEFDIHGGNVSGQALAASVTVNRQNRTKVDIGQHCDGGRVRAGAWTRCKVPLAALGTNGEPIDGVILQENAGRSLRVLYVDNMRLVPVAVAPAQPANLTASSNAGGIALSWGAVPQATGYHVYRAQAVSGPFVRLTSSPVATTSFQDGSISGSGTWHYGVTAINAAGESARSALASVQVQAPEPVPTTASWVYRDQLTPGWRDWSWAPHAMNATSPVAEGNRSISANFGPWQAIYFTHAGFSTADLESFSLRVHGGTGGGGAALRVRAVIDGTPTSGVDLGPTCAAGRVVANQWTTCTVPLDQIAPRGATITGVQIQEWRGGNISRIYLDELGFLPASNTTPVDPVAVAIAPGSASIRTGEQQRFTATVSNATDTRVIWSVQGTGAGTIDGNGLYTAPATAGTFRVVATSVADPSRNANATVTVTAAPIPETPAVTISPLATTVQQGATYRFTATVTGTTNTSVSWSVQETNGGTVNSTGLYTAPNRAGTFHVRATSDADRTVFASATVRVEEAPAIVAVSIDPRSASLAPGGSQKFTATVTGSTDTSVVWSVQQGAAGGTVDSSGLYRAPSAAGTYQVNATSRADASKSATATVTVAPATNSPIDQSILPADRRVTWNPGIPGGIPANRRVFVTLNNLSTDGRGDNAGAINQAILDAHRAYVSSGIIQEVVLPAGTIRVANTIALSRSGVVLRGQGMKQTRLRYDGGGDAIRIGRNNWTDFGAQHGPWNLQADAVKGTRQIVLSNADATKVLVGDILTIDQEDDLSYVRMGDARYEKRQASRDTHGPALRGSGLWRSVTSTIRIASKSVGSSNTTLTLDDPLHMNFRRSQFAQVFHLATEYSDARPQLDGVHYNGVENLYFTGGSLKTNNAAFCWIKNVEVDGNPGTQNIGSYSNQGGITGRSVNLFHAYRCEVRGSYIHHSRSIVQGGGAYLLSISSYTSESLIEDNIVVFGNKLIVGNMMGGGNVIAYNYVDNSRTNHNAWQETALDLNHQSFTHSALVEGNWSTNLTSDTTHGNAGWHVFHRNFGTGQNSNPIYGAYPYIRGNPDGQFRRAAGTDGTHREVTYTGNVLHAGTGTRVYQIDHTTGAQHNAAAVWRIGWGVDGDGGRADDGTALRLTYRHGNWDSVTNGIVWDSGNGNRTLPASFYLKSKPSFFGSNPWPWVNPQGSTAGERVGVLPAKARFDAL